MPRPTAAVSRVLRRDEWELHRREISRLFVVERSPVAEIVEYMKEYYKFDTKPRDYEHKFRKWKLRRNLDEKLLRFIQNELTKRKQAGRPSEVVVSGIKWSESIIRGRLARHKSARLSSQPPEGNVLPDFIARVQTPSPLMRDLPEWPKELPWLVFNQSFHKALATLTVPIVSDRMCRHLGQEALLIEMMRPYIAAQYANVTEPLGICSIPPPRKIRAILEVIAPQAHAGDHEITAEILHTGSHESLAVELIRLLIYCDTNNMIDEFTRLIHCGVYFATSGNMMDFLRGIGFLNKANIDWLKDCPDPTSQTFLNGLLARSIADENSLDVLGWLIPGYHNVNQYLQISEEHWYQMYGKFSKSRCSRFDEEYRSRSTLLQASCLAGNISAVRLLLDLGADPYDTTAPADLTPLECAASLDCHQRASTITDLLLSKQMRSSSEVRKKAFVASLKAAIANAHGDIILRLLSESELSRDEIICAQHFTIAAENSDCSTIRSLVESAQRHGDGSIRLPEDILFSATSNACSKWTDPGHMLDGFNYLLDLGANPGVLRCTNGCVASFFPDFLIDQAHHYGSAIGETCVLTMLETMRKRGNPLERPNPESSGDYLPSALQVAIYHGYTLIVEYLLHWGADIDFRKDESEPIMCWDCNRWSSDSLIEGCSPLLTALNCQRTEIAKILLRRKPSLKLRGGEKELALFSTDPDPELVAMLLPAESLDVDEWKRFFKQSVLIRNSESTKLLLSMDTSGHATMDPATIMRAALVIGDYDKACHQITVCNYDSRALFEAVFQSHRAKEYHTVVERLLQKRTKTPNDELEILAVASAAMHFDMELLGSLMKYLGQGPWFADLSLIRRSLPKFPGWPPNDDNSRFQWHILDYAADLNYRSMFNDEAVLLALLQFHVSAEELRLDGHRHSKLSLEALSQLIAAGLDLPNQGCYLLQIVNDDRLAHVQALCEANIDLNAMHNVRLTAYRGSRNAIQVAIERGSPKMLQMLLHYGADVLQPAGCFCGATCLQLAAGAGNIGLVRFLLSKGANVSAKRSLYNGRTAIEICAENGRLDVLKLLLLQEGHLFQTAAERYQFIRAAKMAEQNGHGIIGKMLKRHINWNSDDQRHFDEIRGSDYLHFHFDDMTEKVSESDRRDDIFWDNMWLVSAKFGVDDIYDIDGIEQWMGKDDRQSNPEGDFSSDGEASVHSSDLLTTATQRSADHDKFSSDLDQYADLMPMDDDTPDFMAYSEGWHAENMSEQAGSHWQAMSSNPVWGQRETALGPQALRYDNNVFALFDMGDDTIDSIAQGFVQNSANDVPTGEVPDHRPATDNLQRESGMVLGEVHDPCINDLGEEVVDSTAEEGIIGVDFDWGFWDSEGVGRESACDETLRELLELGREL